MTITVPNPARYINIGLYFDSHLDSDNMQPQIDNMLQVTPKATNELDDIFNNLSHDSQPKILGDYEMKVVNPNQKANTLLEEEEIDHSPH